MTKAELMTALQHLPDNTPIVDASGHALTLTLPVWEPSGRQVACLNRTGAGDGDIQVSVGTPEAVRESLRLGDWATT